MELKEKKKHVWSYILSPLAVILITFFIILGVGYFYFILTDAGAIHDQTKGMEKRAGFLYEELKENAEKNNSTFAENLYFLIQKNGYSKKWIDEMFEYGLIYPVDAKSLNDPKDTILLKYKYDDIKTLICYVDGTIKWQ